MIELRNARLVCLMIAIVLKSALLASVPPHPRIREMIRRGEIEKPFYMQHAKELRARGINAPWLINPEPGSGLLKSHAGSTGPGKSPAAMGTFNALIVLVSFKAAEGAEPYVWAADPTIFDQRMFGHQAGSLWDYYDKASYGQFNLTTANLPSEIGIVQADCTMAWYTNGENGLGETDIERSVAALVAEIAVKIDSLVDYSVYDNDQNGAVDGFFLVHAGPGAEFTGSNDHIWSHAWETPKDLVTVTEEEVVVRPYNTMPEYWKDMNATTGETDITIGVFAHELAHTIFDLPDLYDIDGSSWGLGNWSLMSGGSWNGDMLNGPGGESPALPDAWSLIEMKITTAINVTDNVKAQTIDNATDSDEIYRLWASGAEGQEYFLVRNRQQKGYDSYLPGAGLTIFHVDEDITGNDHEWYPGFTNNSHYKVALEQADGQWDLEQNRQRGDGGDIFPGSTGSRSFGSFTTPDSRSYLGSYSYVGISNISASAAIMTADFTVFPAPAMAVSPAAIVETVDLGVTGQWTLIIDNSMGDRSFDYKIELSDEARTDTLFTNQSYDWISFSSETGTVAPGGAVTIDVSYDADTLASDVYQVFIHILNNDPAVLDQVINVQLSVSPLRPANISLIADWPNDGGRMMNITWDASLDDDSLGSNPVTYYRVWLRDEAPAPIITPQLVSVNGMDGWGTYVNSIVATGAASYTARVPTHLDSNAMGQFWSYFNVSAHIADNAVAPAFSGIARGYSIDTRGPASPTALTIASLVDSIVVTWQFDHVTNYDFAFFNIYRDTIQTFEPDINTPYDTTSDPVNSFTDFEGEHGPPYFYRVSATDYSGNDGPLSSPTLAGWLETEPHQVLPNEYALQQNYPNPFNPTTTISLTIPASGRVNLTVYNLLGREVIKLVDDDLEPGKFKAHWSGRDAGGIIVPSGLYFARLQAAGYDATIKMLMLK